MARSPRYALLASGLCAALLALLTFCGCGSSPSSETKAQSTAESPQGGEASIEGFGAEARGAEREAIEASFHAYIKALVDKDYPTACAHLSADVKRSLEALIAKNPKIGKGCVVILPLLLSPQAPQSARQEARGEIAKVRSDGERGFIVFKAPGAKLYQQTMAQEGGEWKLATVAASVLVPEV